MDDVSAEIIKATADAALAPITKVISDVVGYAGGDWISAKRERIRHKLKENTRRICDDRGCEPTEDPSPAIILPIISAAQDESREELQDIWARLLAAALDPSRNARYRREYVDVVKLLEPNDVKVLVTMKPEQAQQMEQVRLVSEQTGLPRDQVFLAFHNLVRTRCCFSGTAADGFPSYGVHISPLGRELIALLGDAPIVTT